MMRIVTLYYGYFCLALFALLSVGWGIGCIFAWLKDISRPGDLCIGKLGCLAAKDAVRELKAKIGAIRQREVPSQGTPTARPAAPSAADFAERTERSEETGQTEREGQSEPVGRPAEEPERSGASGQPESLSARELKEVDTGLNELYDRLCESGRRPASRSDRLSVFAYAELSLIGLTVKVQLLTALFLAFSFGSGWLCLRVAEMMLADSGMELRQWGVAGVAADGAEVAESLLSAGFWGVLMLVLFALAALAIAVIFMQKAIKFIIIQSDIVFVASKLAVHIVVADTLHANRISEEVAELAYRVRLKNSSGFLNNILDRVPD